MKGASTGRTAGGVPANAARKVITKVNVKNFETLAGVSNRSEAMDISMKVFEPPQATQTADLSGFARDDTSADISNIMAN